MTREFITSPQQIVEGTFYALPHEIEALSEQMEDILTKRHVLSGHIKDAMEQSSETWHDNAPADALFGEMNALDQKEHKLVVAERNLEPVEYPPLDFDLVTIGSRVGCVIGAEEFEMDITGNLPFSLESYTGVESGSIAAPMPQALLGAIAGSTVVAQVAGRSIEIGVSSVDQAAQRLSFETEV